MVMGSRMQHGSAQPTKILQHGSHPPTSPNTAPATQNESHD